MKKARLLGRAEWVFVALAVASLVGMAGCGAGDDPGGTHVDTAADSNGGGDAADTDSGLEDDTGPGDDADAEDAATDSGNDAAPDAGVDAPPEDLTGDDADAAGDADSSDVDPRPFAERCTEAAVSCVPGLESLATGYCEAVTAEDPCARLIVEAFESAGCFEGCGFGLPGLDEACDEPACGVLVAGLAANGFLTDECATCACIPDCDGAECGSDGCGGSCGDCELDEACGPDRLCEPIVEACDGLPAWGCCGKDLVAFCDGGAPAADPCGESDVCGWQTDEAVFACVPAGSEGDAPAWLTTECPADACIPEPEVCDGLRQQCIGGVDEADPDTMCSAVHVDATGVAPEGGWACEPAEPGEDGCRIAACDDQHYNTNGGISDGCECLGTPRTRSLAACSTDAAGDLGVVSLGGSLVVESGVIPRIDDGRNGQNEDWYFVDFPSDTEALGTVVVDFAVNEGLDYRFEVFQSCAHFPFQGLAFLYGSGAPPARYWRFAPDDVPSPDPGGAAGEGTSLDRVFIRVFRVQRDNTCNRYQLRIERF